MSTFAVTKHKIEKIWEHTNADLLQLAKVEGMTFQFVIQKDLYSEQEEVFYFPIDSVLPEDLIELFDLGGKLAGKLHNRIKTVRLRGEISQGFVIKSEALYNHKTELREIETNNYAELLGVVKYEPPLVSCKAGNLVQLPALVSHYDIEGADRYPKVLEFLMDKKVLITEKLEGSHFAAIMYKDGTVDICQRNYKIEPLEGKEHDWFRASKNSSIVPILKPLLTCWDDAESVAIRGEVIGPGVQKNIYKLKDLEIRVFELEKNGRKVSGSTFVDVCSNLEIPTVPILATNIILKDWLNGRPIAEVSNGYSVLKNDILREGIVVRPFEQEFYIAENNFGRLILKQRSPEYLANSNF